MDNGRLSGVIAVFWHNFGPSWRSPDPSWHHIGKLFGVNLGHLGAILDQPGAILSHLGVRLELVILGHVGAILAKAPNKYSEEQ